MKKEDKIKCHFPGCKEHSEKYWRLEVKNKSKPGNPVFVDLPFCNYHFFVVSGNHFYCEKEDTSDYIIRSLKDKFKIKGPFYLLDFIEQIMGARSMCEILAKKRKEEFK